MTPERWDKVKALFDAALAKPPSERHAFLESACPNDAELRSEVERILADYDGAGSFLEKPLLQPASAFNGTEAVSNRIGQTVSHYRILEKLGEGGMGVVYRAEDSRLGRHVALKFLPEKLSRHPEALERFRREARTASALNHPHICALYDIGPDETPFLVMELLEGETLQKRLARQPVALEELVQVASQITDALAAAHAKGIMHRDLKPANVFLTRQSGVKILDFGLAKLVEPLRSKGSYGRASELSTAAITEESLTRPGTALGTIAYMSPEQALGGEVDIRTDLFSCGVVLYEMATGHRPFQGGTQAALFDAILHNSPIAAGRLNPELPIELERIIDKALEKDPALRYQSAADLRSDVKRIERVLNLATPRAAGNDTRQSPTKRFPLWSKAAMTIIALAAVIGGLDHWDSADTKPFKTMTLTRLTTDGKVTVAAISPDGRYVVHTLSDSGSESLWVRHITTESNVQVVPPAKVTYRGLSFSRDGNFVFYVRSEINDGLGTLYEMPVLGGVSRRVVTDVDSAVTASPDDNKVAFVRQSTGGGSTVIVADIHTGAEQKLSERQGNSFFHDVSWSPDGRIIVCGVMTLNPTYATIVAIPAAGGAERQIPLHKWSGIGSVAWMPDGRGIVLSATEESSDLGTQIWYVRYPSGETRRITNDLNNYETLSVPADSSAIIAVQYDVRSSLWVTHIGETAAASQITSGVVWDGVWGVACAHDGRIIYSANLVGRIDLLSIAVTGGYARQLTSAAHSNVFPRASRDGRYLVFGSNRSGLMHLWIMDADGSNPKQLTEGNLENFPDLSPDGNWIVYNAFDPVRLCKISVRGGKSNSLTKKHGIRPSISPDGKLIAYYDLPSSGIEIMPFEGLPSIKRFDIRIRLSVARVSPPPSLRWTADSRNLLYVQDRAGVSNIYRQPLSGGLPTEVTDFKRDQIFDFDLCPDGRQLALARGTVSGDVVLIRDVR